jgi:hypothetical protein
MHGSKASINLISRRTYDATEAVVPWARFPRAGLLADDHETYM